MALVASAALVACGDGDDGTPTPDDGVCGDGTVDSGEQCDDGNTADGDGCASDCTSEGSGGTGDPELCDDSIDNDGDGDIDCADSDCDGNPSCEEEPAVCGDGTVGGDEECDDGNTEDGDGCAADCTLEGDDPVCGDGNLDDGEECDDGNTDDGDGCAADCTLEGGDPVCGDGNLDDGEECDDGNTDDGDGCAADCTLEEVGPVCGDGNLDDGEECDDGNTDDGDGCAADCTLEPVDTCGDGTVDADEECDDGELNSDTEPGACRTDCTAPFCGDGVVDPGESCDGSDDCSDECTLPPGCGNGQLDEGEECDDGINNSDLIPDACRSTCTLPVCGDLVIDSGEECDNGAENGPDAECTDTCSINLALACEGVPDFIILNEVATTTATGFIYDGTFEDATGDTSPSVGCVRDERTTDLDVMMVFNPPADGAYRISTNTPGNVSDTVIYRVGDCQDPVPGVCNDDDGANFGSTLLLDGLTAGGNIFFVVDRIAGASNSFQIAVDRIRGLVGDGEDCSASDVFCSEGLVCLNDVCQENAAPELTSVEAVAVTPAVVRHTLTGTDINRDVDAWFLELANFADGSILEDIVPVGSPRVTWVEDTFTLVFEIDYPALCTAIGAACTTIPTNVSFYVSDELGNESDIVGAAVTPWTEPETGLGEGDECDIERRLNICDAPFTCTDQGDGTAICDEPLEPELDEVEIRRTAADGVRLFFNGTDVNGDVTAFLLDGLDITGAVVPGNEDIELGFDLTSIGLTEFGLVASLNGAAFAPGSAFAQLRLSLIDAEGLESGEITVAIPNPTGVTLGNPCDLDGVLAICADGSVCSPDGSGGGICAAPAPPEIVTLEATYDDPAAPTTINVQIIGRDSNADVTGLTLTVNTDDGRFVDFGEFASGLCQPDPAGQSAFDCSFEIPLEALPVIEVPWFSVTVELLDSAGLASGPATDGIAPEGNEGELCDLTGGTLGCNTDDGLVCGAPDPESGDSFCEVGVPGELVSLSAIRDSNTTTRFIVEGNDPNGDALFLFGGFFQESGALVTLGGAPFEQGLFALDDNVRGLTDFSTTSTWEFTNAFEQDIAYAEFVLQDTLELQGTNRLQVAVPPLVLEGGECDADGQGVVNLCEDGTSCIGGTCQSAAPTVSEIIVSQNLDNPRLLDINVIGTDADEDVETFTFDFLDLSGDEPVSVTGELAIPAALDLPFGITYEDGNYDYVTQLFWNGDDILGVGDGTLVVTDGFGNVTEAAAFTFRPTVGFADDCDLAEELALCRAGLFCAESLTCDIDEVDPCGGVPLVVAEDIGTETELGLFVPFDTTGGVNFDQADCGAFGPSLGAEVAIAWTAPANGELFITTDTDLTDGFDTYIYAREGFCAEPSAEVACNDDIGAGNFTSEMLLVVTAGQTYYTFIDFFVDDGSGEALFTFTEAAFEGESCESLPCATGLFCDETNLCVPPAALGESCEFIECEDGLFCDGALLCSPPAAIGESCADVPCEAGLVCDSDICITAESSCALATTLPSDFETFGSTFDPSFDDHDVAGCHTFDGGRSPETVFSWTSDYDGTVAIDTLGSAFDTVLLVSAGACDVTSSFLDCNDDIGTGPLQSGLTFTAASGTTYFFFVEAWDGGLPAPGADTITLNLQRL